MSHTGRNRVVATTPVAVALVASAPGNGAPSSPPLQTIDEHGNLRTFRRSYRDLLQDRPGLGRRLSVSYIANNGARRTAFVVLPRWYGRKRHPSIPLVISPHGAA